MNDARSAIVEALMRQSNPSVDPAARSWQERLMNWWQEGAGAPQQQAYEPENLSAAPWHPSCWQTILIMAWRQHAL